MKGKRTQMMTLRGLAVRQNEGLKLDISTWRMYERLGLTVNQLLTFAQAVDTVSLILLTRVKYATVKIYLNARNVNF